MDDCEATYKIYNSILKEGNLKSEQKFKKMWKIDWTKGGPYFLSGFEPATFRLLLISWLAVNLSVKKLY
jgi:hypothetical protein